jgi:hypothetical protein
MRVGTLVSFIPKHSTTKLFMRAYNGIWWWLFWWRKQTQLSHEEASILLGKIVENALIDTFVRLIEPKQMHAVLRLESEQFLLRALCVRMHLIPTKKQRTISLLVLEELKQALRGKYVLLLDGGAISCSNGQLCGTRFPRL